MDGGNILSGAHQFSRAERPLLSFAVSDGNETDSGICQRHEIPLKTPGTVACIMKCTPQTSSKPHAVLDTRGGLNRWACRGPDETKSLACRLNLTAAGVLHKSRIGLSNTENVPLIESRAVDAPLRGTRISLTSTPPDDENSSGGSCHH